MRKLVSGRRRLLKNLLSWGLIAGGVLLLLIFIPYTFWLALLGLLLIGMGLVLLML